MTGEAAGEGGRRRGGRPPAAASAGAAAGGRASRRGGGGGGGAFVGRGRGGRWFIRGPAAAAATGPSELKSEGRLVGWFLLTARQAALGISASSSIGGAQTRGKAGGFFFFGKIDYLNTFKLREIQFGLLVISSRRNCNLEPEKYQERLWTCSV